MRKLKFCIVLVFIIMIIMPVGSQAQEWKVPKGPVDIEADNISYDSQSESYRAEGNVVVKFTGGTLTADTVSVNKSTQEAFAEGNVIIKSEGDVLRGEHVQFNLEKKTGRIENGTLFFAKNHLYLSGKIIEKRGENRYSLVDAKATSCDGERPDWRIGGKTLDVTVDGYGTMKHGTFQIKNYPVLYVPYLIFPAKTTRQTGFLFPRISYSSDKLGWDVGIPFFWAISENADATFYQRYMDKRGFQEGLEFRYCLGDHSFGTMYGDFLNDSAEGPQTDAGGPARDWTENQKRWSYYLNHQTDFSPGVYLRADIKKVSDAWYFKDFDAYNYFRENYTRSGNDSFKRVSFVGDKSLASLDSTARFVVERGTFNITAIARYTDNLYSHNNDTTLQRYPEVTGTIVKQPLLGTPFNFEMDSFYGYYYRTEGYGGHLAEIHPVFSLPLNFGPYLSVTPEVGLRETKWDSSYSDGSQEGSHASRSMYHVGAAASTEFHRIFDLGGEVVDKVRHTVRPEVSYSFVPNIYQGDLPDYAASISQENKITYALTNTLTSRLNEPGGDVEYREFLYLKLSQTYDIEEARRDVTLMTGDRRPFGNLYIDGKLDPFRYLSFETDAIYDLNDGQWQATNHDLTVSDWRGDSLSAQYRYTRGFIEEINLYAKAKITPSVDLSYEIRRNLLEKENIDVTYGLDYRSQCWRLAFTFTDSPDDRRYMVVFSLYGLGWAGKAGSLSSSNW